MYVVYVICGELVEDWIWGVGGFESCCVFGEDVGYIEGDVVCVEYGD